MVTLICGPMFAGKSRTLKQQIERKTRGGKTVALVRPSLDTRGYFTHDDESFAPEDESLVEEFFYTKYPEQLKEFRINEFTPELVKDLVNNFNAVFVDEYFLIKNCKLMAEALTEDRNNHCDIYFAGLLATAENEVWPETIAILPYCDDIKKLSAVCTMCGSEHGNYSLHLGPKTQAIEVGDEAYTSVCKRCYLTATKTNKQ